jgi:cytochrome P450
MFRAVVCRHLEGRVDGNTTSFHAFCHRLSLEVVGRVLWGLSTDEAELDLLLDQFTEFSDKVMRSIWTQLPRLQFDWGRLSPWGRLLRREARMRATFVRKIERLRAAGGESTSVVAHLIEAGLSNDEIVDELFTMLFGGHETTRSSMCWSVFHIVSNPEVQKKLVAEIDERVGERPVEAEDLHHLPYLWAVVHEVLRISPLGPFSGGRIPQRDFELGGYRIRAGDPLVFCWYTMSERDDVWPEAHKFDPDRFFERAASPNDFPFGRGRRICSGRGVALYETAVMLVTLFQTVEIELRHQSKGGDLRGGVGVGTPLGGLPVVLRPRRRLSPS